MSQTTRRRLAVRGHETAVQRVAEKSDRRKKVSSTETLILVSPIHTLSSSVI